MRPASTYAMKIGRSRSGIRWLSTMVRAGSMPDRLP